MADAPARNWLHTFPTLRFTPRLRTSRRHHHHHSLAYAAEDAAEGLVAGFFRLMILTYAWSIAIALWALEAEIWCMIWLLYGFYYLPARWIYRHNVIGRAVTAVTPGPAPAAYDPHGTPPRPVDLARLSDHDDPWDTGSIRRRG